MKDEVGNSVRVEIDGETVVVAPGTSVAAAILLCDGHAPALRRSASGSARGPLCGMGVCFECRVTIDGVSQRRACVVDCQSGMRIQTDAL